MRHHRVLLGVAMISAALLVPQTSHAGFGLFGGHGRFGGASYGGASYGGASYGGASYGGASYGGSSGGASYGSAGAYAAASVGYGSSGGSSGGASYGSSGGLGSGGTAHVGPLKRLAAKIHAHHAAKVAARHSSGGASYGSSGSVAVYRPSYGSSGGSNGGSAYNYSGGSSGSVSAASSYSGGSSGYSTVAPSMGYQSYAPMDSSAPIESYSPMMEGETIRDSGYDSGAAVAPADAPKPAAGDEASLEKDAALLTIAVPETAKVVVNGRETSSRGAVRQFMSNGLKDGFVYTYVVDVTYSGGEEPESKTVKLRAGATERLVFAEPASSSDTASKVTPETVVTLHVPENAKVSLAGNDTKGSGDIRTFRTRQLAKGQAWNNYTIRVTADVNGAPITREKTIDLLAGSDHDFTFNFNDASIASR